jgi:hypothetical protein
VRAVDLQGNLDLQGKGSDVEIENIAGQGDHRRRVLRQPGVQECLEASAFESPNTDLRVEALPGEITWT